MSNSLTDRLNSGSIERVVPEEVNIGTLSMHLWRYRYAKNYCKDKIVLDAACGVGYGTFCLADTAREVIGLDIDKNAIHYANQRYKRDNVSFVQMDISKEIKFRDEYFDIICSFETIEHLYDVDTYLKEIFRVLKNDGVLLLSKPYFKNTILKPSYLYHYIEYSLDDLKKILELYFNKIEFYGQRRSCNTIQGFLRRIDIFNIRQKIKIDVFKKSSKSNDRISLADIFMNDIEIIKGNFNDALSVIALCYKNN